MLSAVEKDTGDSVVREGNSVRGTIRKDRTSPFLPATQAKKAALTARIEATNASIAIPFPPIKPEEFHVQWYGEEYVDESGLEKEEVTKKPVERGWGI